MSAVIIYIDESGDLGWKFDAPYRHGGSSRFLTIAALIVPAEEKHHPDRLIRKLYTARKWSTDKEKKWADMSEGAQLDFARQAARLHDAHPGIRYLSIVVRKDRVAPHIRQDGNKLYNYMIKLLLLREMAAHTSVTLIPDPRSIKVRSGNSLHDYLQTELWFNLGTQTQLETLQMDSRICLGLQFADMLAGMIQSYYEDNQKHAIRFLYTRLRLHRLYFPSLGE